jgi:hypothetical protein
MGPSVLKRFVLCSRQAKDHLSRAHERVSLMGDEWLELRGVLFSVLCVQSLKSCLMRREKRNKKQAESVGARGRTPVATVGKGGGLGFRL